MEIKECLRMLFEFLASWFKDLKTHTFKTEVTNVKLSKFLDKALADKMSLKEITGLLEDLLASSNKPVRVDLSTAKFPTKTIVSGSVRIENPISSVAVTNLPERQKVTGTMEVINFPKEQKVVGEIAISNIDKILSGLQVVVDAINDLKLETSFKGGGSSVIASTVGGAKSNDKIKGTTLFDPNDSAPDYVGIHESSTANEAESGWEILKYTYSGSNVTKITRKVGIWSNRVSLF